jgi:hypothetical protein
LYKILHFSPRETRANDRVRVVLLFRKEARKKKHHVVVVFVVSSSQNDVRSLSLFSLCLSRNARSVSTVFKAHARWEYSPSVRRAQTFAFGAQTEERRFIRNHREKKHLFFIRTLSSSNFVAHDALFLLTQYIRRPVRVDDAKT